MAAVLVAGGGARRMGFDKLQADLCGRPVLWRGFRALAGCPAVGRVVLVASEEAAGFVEPWLGEAGASAEVGVVRGGSERHLSVLAGLEALAAAGCGGDCLVAVHDAARPLLHGEDLAAVIDAAREGPAALAVPVADTLQRADAAGQVTEGVSRDGLWAMQTPQVARLGVLLDVLRGVVKGGGLVTDEVSALHAAGHRVRLVKARHPNFKITWPRDLDLARQLFRPE